MVRLAWWIEPSIVFGAALAVALLVRYLVVRALERSKTLSGVFVDTIRFPSVLWSLAAALAVAVEWAELPRNWADRTNLWIGAFVILSLTLVASSVAVRMLGQYGQRQGMPFAAAGLSKALIRVVILALGAAWLLRHFDKEITPLLTAFGVGGLAVALALKDTLANFFAGIHILVERPIAVGDLIRLESGQEGQVTDIGWRTTRVRTGTNDTVVAPNSKITSGVLINYSVPDTRAVAEVPILVGHGADAEQVRQIALEEAAQVDDVLANPAPLFLCDPGVLPGYVQFKLVVHVADRPILGRVQSELRMRLIERFRAEGVPPPPGVAVSR